MFKKTVNNIDDTLHFYLITYITVSVMPQLSHYSVLAVCACGIQYINWLITLLIDCYLMLSEQYFSYMNVENQFYHDKSCEGKSCLLTNKLVF